jgi:hypothetical protein
MRPSSFCFVIATPLLWWKARTPTLSGTRGTPSGSLKVLVNVSVGSDAGTYLDHLSTFLTLRRGVKCTRLAKTKL